MFCKLFYKEQGLIFWKYPIQLPILFKRYKESLIIQKSQKDVVLVDYKSFLMLQQSDGAHFTSWSHTPRFDVEFFKEKTIHPFLSSLVDKIEEAFSIPEQLKRFTSIDPAAFPKEAKDLTDFGEEGIISLANFFSKKVKLNSVVIPSLVNLFNTKYLKPLFLKTN